MEVVHPRLGSRLWLRAEQSVPGAPDERPQACPDDEPRSTPSCSTHSRARLAGGGGGCGERRIGSHGLQVAGAASDGRRARPPRPALDARPVAAPNAGRDRRRHRSAAASTLERTADRAIPQASATPPTAPHSPPPESCLPCPASANHPLATERKPALAAPRRRPPKRIIGTVSVVPRVAEAIAAIAARRLPALIPS